MSIKRIALKRMNKLHKLAFDIYKENPDLAKRYIFLFWKIKQKAGIKLPKKYRNTFCKKCYTPWIPGRTLDIRIRKGRIILRCRNCGYIKRIVFKN